MSRENESQAERNGREFYENLRRMEQEATEQMRRNAAEQARRANELADRLRPKPLPGFEPGSAKD